VNSPGHAIRTGLVDEIHLFVVPMVIGGGKQVLPSNVCVKLDLLDERVQVEPLRTHWAAHDWRIRAGQRRVLLPGFFSPAVSLTTLTFHVLGRGKDPWAASAAAGLQESKGDEFRRRCQSVSPTRDQPHSRSAS
jgi:hypothetical protein